MSSTTPSNAAAKTKSALNRLRPAWRAIASAAVILFILLAFHSRHKPVASGCQNAIRKDTIIKLPNNQELAVEISDSYDARAVGLGGRPCLGANDAMLFSFENSGYFPFWMKDMKFPIDIIWLNSDRQVVTVQPNIQPSTYPQTFTNTQPAQYVLEMRANRSIELGIENGTQLTF